MKIQTYIALSGKYTRRHADRLVTEGKVFVNGTKAKPGQVISENDTVKVNNEIINPTTDDSVQVLRLFKPRGYICSRADPEGRKTVFSLLPSTKGRSWISIGRLDINTEGLLLFTNSGQFANKLMHPSSNLSRIYQARTFGNKLTLAQIKSIESGIKVDNVTYKAKSINLKNSSGSHHHYEIHLNEGKNREIHNIFNYFGIKVSRLKRTGYANVTLKGLRSRHFDFIDYKSIEI